MHMTIEEAAKFIRNLAEATGRTNKWDAFEEVVLDILKSQEEHLKRK